MPYMQYTEDQMTRWISGTVVPSIPGRYQVKQRNPPKIMTGLYKDGLWKLEDGISVYPPIKPSSQLEWRGLNFEPKPEPRSPSGLNELHLGWNKLAVFKA